MSVENGPKVEAAIFLFSDLLVYTKKQSLLSRRFKVVRFFFYYYYPPLSTFYRLVVERPRVGRQNQPSEGDSYGVRV